MERDGWTTFANGHGAWAAPGGADKQAVVKYETEVNEVQFTTMLAPTAGTCGNGEVDFWAGETCDDTSSCCENCQLVAGAQCSAGFCCDVLTCRYKPTTVTCALDKDENFNVAGCSASNTANCGSCYNGACSRFSGQTKGNTDWCPATGGCMQRIAYDFGNGPTCTGSFYNGAKTVPAGAVCAISGSQQQLCEITGTDTAICGAAADPIPAYSVQPPCPFCSTPAGTPCALRATWEEVDAMQLAGTQVHTGGLGEQMTAEYEVGSPPHANPDTPKDIPGSPDPNPNLLMPSVHVCSPTACSPDCGWCHRCVRGPTSVVAAGPRLWLLLLACVL